jgi:hypothetical protein
VWLATFCVKHIFKCMSMYVHICMYVGYFLIRSVKQGFICMYMYRVLYVCICRYVCWLLSIKKCETGFYMYVYVCTYVCMLAIFC